MSLEAQISKLNDSVQALIIALTGTKPAAAQVPAQAQVAAPSPVQRPEPATAAAPSPVAEQASTQEMQYADIGVPFGDFVKAHGRDKALTILAEFGIKRLPEAKPEDWPAILAAVKAAS